MPATPGSSCEYWRSGTAGTATTRCWKPSNAIVTGALDAASGVGSSFAPTPASSSLCGSTGLGSPLRSTATYSPKVCRRSYDVMSSHCDLRPRSVEARNHRYLPLASHTGNIASAKPSVT